MYHNLHYMQIVKVETDHHLQMLQNQILQRNYMNIFEKNKLIFSVPINTTFIDRNGKEHNYSGITDDIDGDIAG